MSQTKTICYGAAITVGSLIGGLVLGLLAGSLIFGVLAGHDFQSAGPVQIVLAAIPALGGFFVGGAVWGVLMGRLVGITDRRRLAIAGALGYAPITIALAILLQVLEPIALAYLGAVIPLHRIFTLLFVPSAFLITGVSACALGIGLGGRVLASALWWRAGLAAAVVFLLVNLTMDTAGWVVGAPGAGERLTMLTVLFTSNLGAAIAGGTAMGLTLSSSASRYIT